MPTAASPRQGTVAPSAQGSAAVPAGNPVTPAETTTKGGTSGGGRSGALIGVLGVVIAVGGGGVTWRQLRRKRAPKTTPAPPITVQLAPLAPRDPLALPPAAPPAGQGQGMSQEQAPWEQQTLVDMRLAPSPRPAQPTSVDLRLAPGQPTLVDMQRVPSLPGDASPRPQGPPPSPRPVAGRHAHLAPRLDKGRPPYPPQGSGPAPGRRRKPQ